MFVFNTIELKEKEQRIETTNSIRQLGLSSAIISYVFLYMALLSNAQSRYIIASGLIFFIFSGMYFFIKKKSVYLLPDKQIKIDLKLMGISFRSNLIKSEKILDIFSKECSHGQMIQKKYRIFIKTVDRCFDIGIVSHSNKVNEIITFIRNHINKC